VKLQIGFKAGTRKGINEMGTKCVNDLLKRKLTTGTMALSWCEGMVKVLINEHIALMMVAKDTTFKINQ
jgi:hypothetical protein